MADSLAAAGQHEVPEARSCFLSKGCGAALATYVILLFPQLAPANHIEVNDFHDMVVSFCFPAAQFWFTNPADSNVVLRGVRCSISCITILRGFMDFEHVGVKTTEFMAATSECGKPFFGQQAIAGHNIAWQEGVSSWSYCFTSDCILLHHVVAMARVLKLAGVACSTHRSRGGAPASGHIDRFRCKP